MKAVWAVGLLLVLRWGPQQVSAAAAAAGAVDYWDELELGPSASVADASNITSPAAPVVPLTLIQSAVAKGAVCLDGTPPGYHLHPAGSRTGQNSWLVVLEGGGWCNNLTTCELRKTTNHGSSNYMDKELNFTGILSDENCSCYLIFQPA